jgi:hypothetical protein
MSRKAGLASASYVRGCEGVLRMVASLEIRDDL